MLTNPQKAEAVVAALEEENPQLLAELLKEPPRLLALINDRVQKYNLEYVRRMQGQPQGEEMFVVESLMPMLTEFPEKPGPKLTPAQEKLARKVLDQYEDSLPPLKLECSG